MPTTSLNLITAYGAQGGSLVTFNSQSGLNSKLVIAGGGCGSGSGGSGGSSQSNNGPQPSPPSN